MEPCNIAHEVVKTVSGDAARGIEVKPVETLHDIAVIGNFKIRNDRIAEPLHLDVFAVVLSDRDGGIDDIRNGHHDLCDLFVQLRFLGFQRGERLGIFCHLLFGFLGLGLFALRHVCADQLGDLIAVCAQSIRLAFCLAVFLVESNDLVDKR